MTPSIPTITLNYDLANVASAVSNWFSAFWLILAFAVAIPLAFYVGHRVKGLFS
jgi:hypothetical protein